MRCGRAPEHISRWREPFRGAGGPSEQTDATKEPALAVKLAPNGVNRRRLYGGIALGLFLGGVGTYALGGTFAGLAADATRSDTDAMRTTGLTFLGIGTATVLGSAVMLGLYVRERKRK